VHRFESVGATLAILGLAVAIASFYVLLKFREPRWKLEMDNYVGAQIRERLIALVPEDLNITPAEREQLASSEIYRELTGVFWEAVDQNAVLRAHKEHFYSNGIEYSTAIDIFLLCLFFCMCYAIAWLVIRDTFLLYTAGCLISIALIARWIAIPKARRRHLSLSAEQLELLKREMGVFVADRFRQIVLGWRVRGRPGDRVSSGTPKTLAFWKEARVGLPLLTLVALALIAGQKLGLGLGANRSPEVKSGYVTAGKHHKFVAVVFVHGVFGTKEDTWLSRGHGGNFPELLATDPELKDNVDVFTFEYFTPKSGAAPSIVDLANQLRGELDDHHVFEDHEKVAFLAHSMGGIVVRQFLLNHQDRIGKVPMVFFYATPTNGSDLASLAKLASSNPQLRGMVPLEGNDFLQSIQSGWLASDQAKSIASHCAVETLPIFGIMIVSRSSATALCNREIDPFSADHIDIVKPTDREDPRYTRFATALSKEVLNTSSARTSHPAIKILHANKDLQGRLINTSGRSDVLNGLVIPAFQLQADQLVRILSVRLYLSEGDARWNGPWEPTRSDEEQFPIEFFWAARMEISPHETWNTPEFIVQRNRGKPFSRKLSARIKVFYGADKPAVADFTLHNNS
jgi:pimeloyl-ACP methyl ester carboxylesterase